MTAETAIPDTFTIENWTPWIGKEFAISHPNIPSDFKLRLTNAYDPSNGASHPKFRKPLTLLFRGPSDPLLIEGFYEIKGEEGGLIGMHIIPTLTPDREENGMAYHAAFN